MHSEITVKNSPLFFSNTRQIRAIYDIIIEEFV